MLEVIKAISIPVLMIAAIALTELSMRPLNKKRKNDNEK